MMKNYRKNKCFFKREKSGLVQISGIFVRRYKKGIIMAMQYQMNKSLLRAKNMLSRQKMRLIFTALLFCDLLSCQA